MTAKRSIGVTIISSLQILGGFLAIVRSFIGYSELKPFFTTEKSLWLPSVLGTAYVIAVGVYCIILGIGLLRLKPWARSSQIALILIYVPFFGLFQIMFFGWQFIAITEILWMISVSGFIIYFFMKKSVKEQFNEEYTKLTIKSGYGKIFFSSTIILVLFLVSYCGYKSYISLTYNEPFFNITLPKIKLSDYQTRNQLEQYKRIELLGQSVFVTQQTHILNLNRNQDLGVDCWLKYSKELKHKVIIGFIEKSAVETMESMYKYLKFKNAYDFERAIYTNNSSILLSWIRIIQTHGTAQNIKIEEIDSPNLKGFILSSLSENKKKIFIEGHFYKNDLSFSRNVMIVTNKEYYDCDKKEIYKILSSFEFSKEQKTATDFYRQGLDKLKANKTIDAQFDFANAYALSPEPEYGFLLAKTLFLVDEKTTGNCKQLLEDVLKVKPTYKEAQELLENIKRFELKEKPEKEKVAETETN